jgi:BirA family biotin operon repressor/biotin-[acetyl-CoA-carboxylase] ligase
MTQDAATHLHWNVEALWQRLLPLLPRLSVEVLARCESTNTVLIERARQAGGDRDAPVTSPAPLADSQEPGEPPAAPAGWRAGARPTRQGRRGGDHEPCLLVAEQQTHGRGRLGRLWVAGTGASLTFSLALPLAPRDWSGLSLAVGLALAEALDPLDAPEQAASRAPGSSEPAPPMPRIALKWPNDLWLVDARGGRKLGGVLIETVSVGHQRMCVVGVGINVQPLPPEVTDALSSGYACLQEIDAEAAAPDVLAHLAVPLVRAVQAFEQHGFAPLAARYARRDLLRGHQVTTALPRSRAWPKAWTLKGHWWS